MNYIAKIFSIHSFLDQNPLFYQLNSHDIDCMETEVKWEDQFLEMDVPNDSSSDNENYFDDNFNRSFKVNIFSPSFRSQ